MVVEGVCGYPCLPSYSCAKQQFRGAETWPWKMADAVPVPKLKPVTDINKHLRPIFLTPVICNIIVALHVGLAVLEVIDTNKYGCIRRPLPYTPLRLCYTYLVTSH